MNDDKYLDNKEKAEEHQQDDKVVQEQEIKGKTVEGEGDNKREVGEIEETPKRKKVRKNDIIYFTLVGATFIIVLLIFLYLTGEAGQCLDNPYLYGASGMGNVECSCVQYNHPTCPPRFSFNDTFYNITPTICGTGLTYKPREMNWSITPDK